MKEIKTDDFHGDPRIRFKHQSLLQDYHELRKETEVTIRKLEMVKQRKLIIKAEVKFLRRRYKQLTQEQTVEAAPKMSRLSESGDLKMSSKPSVKRRKHSGLKASVPCSDLKQKNTICNGEDDALANNGSCDLEKKPKRSRGNEVLTNSVSIPDLNGDENTFVDNKVSGFDLNQISRDEEEPEANGEQKVEEGTKNAILLGNGINELELPICRDVEKEMNRAIVKRKVSWQDPVALSV